MRIKSLAVLSAALMIGAAPLANAEELTLQDLKSRSLPNRLIDRLFWLGSPYL